MDADECRKMATKGTLTIENNDVKTPLNEITHSSFFTHGSVKYTGDNIECTGESLRLSNGQVNQNMIWFVNDYCLIEIA